MNLVFENLPLLAFVLVVVLIVKRLKEDPYLFLSEGKKRQYEIDKEMANFVILKLRLLGKVYLQDLMSERKEIDNVLALLKIAKKTDMLIAKEEIQGNLIAITSKSFRVGEIGHRIYNHIEQISGYSNYWPTEKTDASDAKILVDAFRKFE